MRARPAGPAESAALHYSARSGPTKEAHRRALDRPDGLLRSVAGQVDPNGSMTKNVGMTLVRSMSHAYPVARAS
jgi:hypothetical protein